MVMAAAQFGQSIARPIRNFGGCCAKNTTLPHDKKSDTFQQLGNQNAARRLQPG
jgi:hypothetical protein